MSLLKILPIAVVLFSLIGCAGEDPVDFARTGFSALARGDSSAEDLIDWEGLMVNGESVGLLYMAMPNEKEKSDFRMAFVASFAASFQSVGGSADSMTDWQVESEDSARTVISFARPGENASATITISKKNGSQKISAFTF